LTPLALNISQGTVVEKGTHDQLMADERGLYRALVRAQDV
jgi:ABC-type multidrug transport system fused ATPase/permease subunit